MFCFVHCAAHDWINEWKCFSVAVESNIRPSFFFRLVCVFFLRPFRSHAIPSIFRAYAQRAAERRDRECGKIGSTSIYAKIHKNISFWRCEMSCADIHFTQRFSPFGWQISLRLQFHRCLYITWHATSFCIEVSTKMIFIFTDCGWKRQRVTFT